MSDINYITAFTVGLIASVSSCMAVVGGIVLSMSANYTKSGENNFKPQLLFHIGRLVSFFIFGGVVGLLGASFQLSATSNFVLTFLVAMVMIILGLNLLDIFPWASKLQITLPGSFRDKIQNFKNFNHNLTPILIGVVTFFLPCGFTQSMQIYTLSTGSFWTGAFTMLTFALGTLPVLAILSFGSLGIHKKAWSGIFLKIAGIVVIFFGLFNLMNSLAIIDIKLPSFNYSRNIQTAITSNVDQENGIQIINLTVSGGYSPEKSVAKAGVPTIIRFNTSNTFDCSLSVRIPSKNINQFLPQTGTTDINIGTQSAGLFRGTCGMGMYVFEIDFK
jgi:sulfite exporter TauE/SafE